MEVCPEHERILPVLLRPFQSAPKSVLPEVDPATEPVVVVRARLELSLAEQNGLPILALTPVIADDEAVVVWGVARFD